MHSTARECCHSDIFVLLQRPLLASLTHTFLSPPAGDVAAETRIRCDTPPVFFGVPLLRRLDSEPGPSERTPVDKYFPAVDHLSRQWEKVVALPLMGSAPSPSALQWPGIDAAVRGDGTEAGEEGGLGEAQEEGRGGKAAAPWPKWGEGAPMQSTAAVQVEVARRVLQSHALWEMLHQELTQAAVKVARERKEAGLRVER